jgi:Flp pilus assembly pilin Flp
VPRGAKGSAARGYLLAFARRESGQDVVEYGMIIALIAVVILLGVTAFGQQIEPWFLTLAGRITTTGT